MNKRMVKTGNKTRNTDEKVEALYVTMTEARRTFKHITEEAAAGKVVIITKQSIPFLQLVPLRFQIIQPATMSGIVQPDPIGGQPVDDEG